MDDDWKVKIQEDGPTFFLNVWIYRRTLVGKMEVLGSDDKLSIYTEGNASIPPSLRLLPPMLTAFSDALNSRGIKPSHESKVEGLLQGTERHLQDLRKLLKLND